MREKAPWLLRQGMDIGEANNRTRSGTYLHRSNVYDSLFADSCWRQSAFLVDCDHDSCLIPISIPGESDHHSCVKPISDRQGQEAWSGWSGIGCGKEFGGAGHQTKRV